MAAWKSGRALEILVAGLEKALSMKSNVTVHSPLRVPDRTTGELREHDVVLDVREGHHSVLIAIECRDRSRPVGVPQVEAFGAKCRDTGISQGIIVSTTGFYRTARIKAGHLGIRCFGIDEVDKFGWLIANGIESIKPILLSNDWVFNLKEQYTVEIDDLEVIDLDGKILTATMLTENACQQIDRLLREKPELVQKNEVRVRFGSEGLVLRLKSTGETLPVESVIVTMRYSVKHEFIPFRLVQYTDMKDEVNITDAAYADMRFGDKEARMIIVYNEEKGAKFVLIPKGEGKD